MSRWIQPPRLKDGDEFGPLLRDLDSERLAAEQLAQAGKLVNQRLAAAAGAGVAIAPWIKWLMLVSLIGTGMLVAIFATRRDPPSEPPRPPAEPVAIVAPHRAPPPPVDPPPVPLEAEPLPAPASPPPGAAHRSSGKVARPGPDTAAVAEPPPEPAKPSTIDAPELPAPPRRSELPEQVQRFEAARNLAKAGSYPDAVAMLDQLLRRFPDTLLREDVELSKAEYLIRADRRAQAIAYVEGLIAAPRHAARKGELSRVLADLVRKQGDCARASILYRQALELELSRRDRAAAERGIERCSSK